MSYAKDIKWIRELEKSAETRRNQRARHAIGTRVTLRPDFGHGLPIEVTITDFDEEGKYGKPIISYQNENGDSSWAYTYQIV